MPSGDATDIQPTLSDIASTRRALQATEEAATVYRSLAAARLLDANCVTAASSFAEGIEALRAFFRVARSIHELNGGIVSGLHLSVSWHCAEYGVVRPDHGRV